MAKHIRVHVTQEHIDNGTPDFYGCPIALALNEKFPGAMCRVELAEVTIWEPEETYILSAPAEDFVVAFDEGSAVEPSTFDLWH